MLPVQIRRSPDRGLLAADAPDGAYRWRLLVQRKVLRAFECWLDAEEVHEKRQQNKWRRILQNLSRAGTADICACGDPAAEDLPDLRECWACHLQTCYSCHMYWVACEGCRV